MSDLPVFIAGLIIGLVAGLIVARLRQPAAIQGGPAPNTLIARGASPAGRAAPPPRASDRPAGYGSSRPFVGRQALLGRLATDLAGKLDRSEESGRRRDR